MNYRTYIDTEKGYRGKGTHNIKRTIKLLDKLIYEENIKRILVIMEEDHTDIPVLYYTGNIEEYDKFRSEHYESKFGTYTPKHK